jgi:hypothetical protein
VTAFHGAPRAVEGLGLLPWSNCVHLDEEPARESSYRKLLMDGMAPGYACENGAALHFSGARLTRVVTSRPDARAFRMRRAPGGRIERRPLVTSYLGEPAARPLAAVA